MKETRNDHYKKKNIFITDDPNTEHAGHSVKA